MGTALNVLKRLKAAGRRARALAGLNPPASALDPASGDRLAMYEAILRAQRTTASAATLDHVHFPLSPPTGTLDREGRPLPPLGLAQRIGAPTFADFEFIGQQTRQTILRCLPRDFAFKDARVLDFGCGVARVLRYFSTEAEAQDAEFWGCDIDGPSIRWCVENLSPPFRFFQLGEVPSIPLEDASFDLVYAISVFAHIHADWHHWLMEVRRILKPGGYAFVTFMAQTPFEEMLGRSYWDYGPDFGKHVQNPFLDWNAGGPMAFHSPDWIRTFWGSLFDIEFIALDGLLDYQSICLMRKPERGRPRQAAVPVLQNATRQKFDPDAVGRIFPAHDLTKPYRDSYGVEAQGVAEIAGWIVFRGDTPSGLDVRIDKTAIAAKAEFEADSPYRDWGGSMQTAFSARIDLSGIAPGEHVLDILLHSTGRKTHSLSVPLIVRRTGGAPAGIA